MVDNSMLPLISYLRAYGNCKPDDELDGATDDRLQEMLYQRSEIKRVAATRAYTTNPYVYNLLMSRGNMLSFDYTLLDARRHRILQSSIYEKDKGTITLTEPIRDDIIYVEGHVFNMWLALADLWDMKAVNRQAFVDFRAGHNTMDLSREYEHCVRQRDYYRNKVIRSYKR